MVHYKIGSFQLFVRFLIIAYVTNQNMYSNVLIRVCTTTQVLHNMYVQHIFNEIVLPTVVVRVPPSLPARACDAFERPHQLLSRLRCCLEGPHRHRDLLLWGTPGTPSCPPAPPDLCRSLLLPPGLHRGPWGTPAAFESDESPLLRPSLYGAHPHPALGLGEPSCPPESAWRQDDVRKDYPQFVMSGTRCILLPMHEVWQVTCLTPY
jgi:hypothetical protein